jgi:HSP20 family protein
VYTKTPLSGWMTEMMHRPVNDLNREIRTIKSRPAVNVTENADAFIIQMALPGYTKEQIVISQKDEMLTVTNKEQEATEVNYRHREFNYASFARTFKLDRMIDKHNIHASMDQGILTIELKKKEEVKPRTIQIS